MGGGNARPQSSEPGPSCIIFRPGNMGGDSGTRGGNCAWNTSDFNYLLITGCILLKCFPDVGDWIMELTPVDIAAHIMVSVVADGDAASGETFHATNFHKSMQASFVFDAVRKLGYPLKGVSLEN